MFLLRGGSKCFYEDSQLSSHCALSAEYLYKNRRCFGLRLCLVLVGTLDSGYQIPLVFSFPGIGWGVYTATWVGLGEKAKGSFIKSQELPWCLLKMLLQQWCVRQDGLYVQCCEINGNADWQGAFTIHFLSQFCHCLMLFFDVWLKRRCWYPEWGQQVLCDHYGQLLILCDTLGSWGDVGCIWRLISFGDFNSLLHSPS